MLRIQSRDRRRRGWHCLGVRHSLPSQATEEAGAQRGSSSQTLRSEPACAPPPRLIPSSLYLPPCPLKFRPCPLPPLLFAPSPSSLTLSPSALRLLSLLNPFSVSASHLPLPLSLPVLSCLWWHGPLPWAQPSPLPPAPAVLGIPTALPCELEAQAGAWPKAAERRCHAQEPSPRVRGLPLLPPYDGPPCPLPAHFSRSSPLLPHLLHCLPLPSPPPFLSCPRKAPCTADDAPTRSSPSAAQAVLPLPSRCAASAPFIYIDVPFRAVSPPPDRSDFHPRLLCLIRPSHTPLPCPQMRLGLACSPSSLPSNSALSSSPVDDHYPCMQTANPHPSSFARQADPLSPCSQRQRTLPFRT